MANPDAPLSTCCSPTPRSGSGRGSCGRCATARVAAGLARHPRRSARRVGGLGAELARVAAGRSDRRPAKGDRRFADPAWESSWLFRRLMQTYLVARRDASTG